MAKLDTILESYDRAVGALFSDREVLAEYLKFSGRFYKLPSSQAITLFDDNPSAKMVADYETWRRFKRTVKPNGWATEVISDGQIKRLFDISMTRGENVPYQWRLEKYLAEKYMEQLSARVPQPFTNMSGAVNYLSENGVNKSIGAVFNKLNVPEDKAADFKRSFYTMVRTAVAARCELNSDFVYKGSELDLSAVDMLRDMGEFETLLEQVQITAKDILKSMEESIKNIIYERSIVNERVKRIDGARDNGVERAGAEDMVRGGETVSSVDESTRNAQRDAEAVSAERENVRVRADDGVGTDGRGARADDAADQPMGTGVAAVYDGELPGGYSDAAGQISLGFDSAQDRQGGVGDHGENAGGLSADEPAPDLGERGGLGGAAAIADTGADNGNSGERAQDGAVTDNNETAEEHSPAVSYLAIKIAELSDKFTEKYDGDYSQFTLANFAFKTAFKHRSAEYDLNKSVRENAEKMLSDGDIPFVREYLNTIFKEAFEGRIIVDEGKTAGELLGRLSAIEHTKTEHAPETEGGEQLRLMPEPLNKKQQTELEKLTAALTDEFDRWENVFLDGGSDRIYEDGVSLDLIRNHIINYKRELEEKFPDYLPEIYSKETPPEYPMNYQSVKKGDVLRFEYGDFLVAGIEKKDEYSGEYSVELRDENGETITQDLSAIKTKFRNLTNRGEETETRFWEPSEELNKFYVDRDRDEVCMVYYNPDSTAGGSLVYNYFSFDDLEKALSSERPFDSILDVCRTEWLDKDASVFEESMREFMRDSEDFQSRGNVLPSGLAELLAGRKEEARQRKDGEIAQSDKQISEKEVKSEAQEKSFSEQVDEVIAGTANRYNDLKVCDTPQILLDVGCEQLPMMYTQNHMRKAFLPKNRKRHTHGIDVSQMKNVPNKLAEPIMVLDSYMDDSSIIAVLNDYDKDNSPLIATIVPNGKGYYDVEVRSNFITSIYGRDGFGLFIEKTIESDGVLYYDKEKSQELFSVLGLEFPKGLNNLDSNVIIHESFNIVNPFSEEIIKSPEQAKFFIYQLKKDEKYHGIRFEGFEENKDYNLTVQDYDLVYTGDWESVPGNSSEEKMECIYKIFNEHRPDDFTGHSLSVSDVVAVGYDGAPDSLTAHYVDTLGFTEMQEFFKEKELDRNITSDTLLPPSRARAEELINEYCEREFGSEGDFSNPARVGLAYTDDEETGLPKEVYADLESFRIVTEFNNVVVAEEKYKTLDEMCVALDNLSFDDLVYLTEEQRIKGIEVSSEELEQSIAQDTLNFSFGDDEYFTESSLLADFANQNPDMSFALANAVIEYLDEKQHSERIVNGLNAGWYDKTDFELKAIIGEDEFNYDGRYDIGDGKGTGGGSLIEHIADVNRHRIQSETGLYSNDDKQTAQTMLDKLIPFLEKNSVLTPEEQKIIDEFKAKNPIRTFADVKNVEPKPVTAEKVGDFYEFYGEDARLVAAALGLNITSKNHRDMTGFPDHMFSENAEKLAKFGYSLLDGTALAEERLRESTEKIKAAHEREARFETTFEQIFENTELDEKQRRFLERAKSSMQINGFERLEDVFNMPAFQAAYGTPENVYKLFGGEEKFREIEEHINAALSGSIESVSPVTQNPVDVISDFREKTDEYYNKLGGYSAHSAEELVKYFIRAAIRENELSAEVGDVVLYGSRCRGMESENSDLDFVAEMRSDLKEDALFNILHETPFEIGGVTVDINPIRAEESGSLEDYLTGAELYLQQKGAKENKAPELQDYRVEEIEQTSFGQKARYAANVAAIRTLKQIESENRAATPDEKKIIAQYVGWGGIPSVFDSDNTSWAAEYAELKELLTPDEYEAARSTVLTAHYTSPTIISAIYSAIENFGFKGGNILEPSMGIGNFFGVMPEEMRSQSSLHGVELDDISGRIAKQLYPNADVQICGYESTAFPDNFFDAAVGNVPFGNYGVADTRYDREHFLIHDYFFAKTLDKVAPGGVVAFITSKGTLDKESPKVREYLTKRADLVGAIRLPNNAFKSTAGTEVTADIIFLQKREKMSVEKPDWCYTAEISEGISVNQYFADHPEMILGKMQLVSGRYGFETACVPIEGADLKEQLAAAVARLKRDIITARRENKRNEEHGIIPATADVRNFTFTEVNDKIYFRENNIMREIPFSKKNHERMRGMIGIRNTFRELVDAQSEGCSDETLSGLQFRLNAEYDAFVINFGHISDIENRKLFAVDDDYNTLCGALELIDPEAKTVTKADIFFKRTIKPYAEVTHVDTPQEALFVSLDMRGAVDIDYMSELCSTSKDEVISDLVSDGLIYKNPETEMYEEAAEYLSGYVREKLRKAQDAAAENPDYERNVAALEKALPPKLGAGDISVRLGAPWIEIVDYCKFFREYAQGILSEGSWRGSDSVLHRTIAGEYKINNKNADKSVASQSSFGTKRMNSYAIFENLLNNRDVAVYDTFEDSDGKKRRVMNKDETQLAQEKARQMKEAFPKWLWSDPERREKYVEVYNELFNSLVGREYDGSHQTFPGMNPFIELTDHQKNAVMRAKVGGNTLLAHCVGAGKTFEMAAAVMEKRRLGLINKACIVVPKHLVGQMSAEWLRLYPEARLLTARENDFNEVNRQKFIGRCCTGDYDAVIMSYQQFQKIPMSAEYQRDFLTRQIKELTEHLADYKGQYLGADERRSVKDIERMKKNLQVKLKKLLDTPHDNSLSFEQLGFDCIVADEAHNFKNGLVVTKMKNVSGIGSKAAKKCEDFLMKTQYLNDKFSERNMILATGTPVSNSMTELYIMQQYLRPSTLKRQGLQNFDDWASTFGEVVSQLELKPAGDGFRMKKRFAKFNNLPELMQTYKDFADIRTSEMLNLPVPEVEGGKPQVISAKPNEFQKAYMQVLADRSEAIHEGHIDPSVDNMLKITNEARLLGLDARCINPDADNYPNGKVNLLISKVMEIYTETTEQKGVQAIFCDIAINADKRSADEITVNSDETLDDDGEKVLSAEQQAELLGASKFSVYDYIKQELIRRGVPESEICFAGDAKNIGQRNELYAQLRAGTKRIVLASTTKMGTGANVQTRLCALHNLDIPWKPSDFEQRIGRIVRQGNNFPNVKIFNYVTEGTFDAYMLNLIVTKQKFISQLMSGKTPARTCEDVDELVLNYSEMQAIASGDPRIKEKIQLDTDVARLRLLESEHLNAKYQLEDKVTFCQAQISIAKKQLALAHVDKAFAAKTTLPEGEFKMTINGKIFTERKDAGAELRKAQMSFLSTKKAVEIGEYRGFIMSLNWAAISLEQRAVSVSLTQKGGKGLTYSTELELQNDLGNVMRIENIPKSGIDKRISVLNSEIARNEKDLAEANRTKDAPFEYAAELEEKSKRLAQLDAELGVGKKDEVIIDDSGESQDDDTDLGNNALGQGKKPKRPKH